MSEDHGSHSPQPGAGRAMSHDAAAAAFPSESGGRVEVVVIGAGQAGLAIGHFLARAGRRFVILEAGESVGTAWRGRWDSLVLFTPRRYDALPGLPFPGEPDGYPGRDEVVAYLEQYARTFDLPVRLRSQVRSLQAEDDGFVLELADGRRVAADQVVVATGPFHVPSMPALSDELDPALFQAHSAAYRSPSRVPDGHGPRRRRRQHRLPDRQGAVGDAHRAPCRRLAPDPAAAAAARARPVLVADAAGPARQERRLARGSPRARSRHAHRLEPARAQAPVRRRPQAAGDRRLGADGALRRRHAARRRRRRLGDRLPARPLLDRSRHRRRERPAPPPARGHRHPRPVLPRPVLAAHARLGAARLRQGRRRVHRRADRRASSTRRRRDDRTPKATERPSQHKETDMHEHATTPRRRARSRPTRPASSARPTRDRSSSPTAAQFDLRIAPVAKQLGDATVRMLGYNGSVPGPTLKVARGRGGDRPGREPRRPRGDRALARAAPRQPLRRNARDAAPMEIGESFDYRLHFPDAGALLVPPAHPPGLRPGDGPLRQHPRRPRRPGLLGAGPPRARVTLDDILIEDGQVAPFSPTETTYAAMGRFGNELLVNGEPSLRSTRTRARSFASTSSTPPTRASSTSPSAAAG